MTGILCLGEIAVKDDGGTTIIREGDELKMEGQDGFAGTAAL